MSTTQNLSHRIQAYIRASISGRNSERIGPFVMNVDPDTANPFLNYGIPDEDAQPSQSEIAELIAAFERHERTPRLEYLPEAAPEVEAAFLTAGFKAENRLPVMICTPQTLAPLSVPDGIELLAPTTDVELRATAGAQNEAYGEAATTEADVNRLRRILSGGGAVILAREAGGGDACGAGVFPPPHDGITEVAAVGVRERFRRRGIATAITVRLTQDAFAAGVTLPFLTPIGEDEERIYARAGFNCRMEILHISR